MYDDNVMVIEVKNMLLQKFLNEKQVLKILSFPWQLVRHADMVQLVGKYVTVGMALLVTLRQALASVFLDGLEETVEYVRSPFLNHTYNFNQF